MHRYGAVDTIRLQINAPAELFKLAILLLTKYSKRCMQCRFNGFTNCTFLNYELQGIDATKAFFLTRIILIFTIYFFVLLHFCLMSVAQLFEFDICTYNATRFKILKVAKKCHHLSKTIRPFNFDFFMIIELDSWYISAGMKIP